MKTLFREDKFAQRDKHSQGNQIERIKICDKGQFCTEDHFTTRIKNIYKKQKKFTDGNGER